MVETNEIHLLKILQDHGQQFLESFPSLDLNTRKRQRDLGPVPPNKKANCISEDDDGDDGEEEEEWLGITNSPNHGSLTELTDDDDDNLTNDSSATQANVMVFRDHLPIKAFPMTGSKLQMKAFMSSKVDKMRQEMLDTSQRQKTSIAVEDERSNAHNDTLLHQLVHTKILSGSLNPDLDLTPAHRRRALAGRVLELSGEVRIGKGEKSMCEKERNKAAKQVREGIVKKQRKRSEQQLEEAKNMGNYHPMIKKHFESSSTRPSKRRERGLKLGVGKFHRGSLKLSREEVNMVEGKRPSRRG